MFLNRTVSSAFSATLFIGTLGFGLATDSINQLEAADAETKASATNAPIKTVGPGRFEIGRVQLDQTKRTITFAGKVNMSEGLIEYLVVHESGKIHESLLHTEVEPYHVHLAALLLSKPEGNIEKAAPSAPKLIGTVTLWLSWAADGTQKRYRAEDFADNLQTKMRMTRGPWKYVGSRVVEGTFLAQRDGSIISVLDDADALINNPRPGRENDENWQINAANLPPVGSPVQITIQFEEQ